MTETLDTARAEAFGERLLGALNDAALILMTSLGQRSGLFDTLAGLPPSTSAQIAEEAGLQERYVREWLGAMVVSRVVEYDPTEGTYSLPAEHAATLTRPRGRTTSPRWRRTCRCLRASRTRSLNASAPVGECRTRLIPGSRR